MCAGKLLSLIKKCLHREKNGQKSDSGTSSKSGQKSQATSGHKKRGSPQPVGCCSVCHQASTQMPSGQMVSGTPRSGYQRLCQSPGTASCNMMEPGRAPQSGYYIGNPVVYVPSAMEHIEQEVALQRERQIRLHGYQMDMELNLPPSVRISEDGEEGYLRSQRYLKLSCDENGRRESIRPPPNKIVYQGDSPPPYRSNSVSKIEGHYYGGGKRTATTASHLAILANKFSCGNNSPNIARCHSISGEIRPVRTTCAANHHGCHTGPPSCGHVTTASSRCYHGYHSSQLACSHPSHSSHSHSCSPPGGALHASGGATTPQTISSAHSAKALKTRMSSQPVSHIRTDSPANTTSSHNNTSTGCHSAVHGPVERVYFGPPPVYTEVASAGSTVSGPTATSQPTQSDSKV